MMNTKEIKPASGKQLKWLKSLITERSWDAVPAEWHERLAEIAEAFKACDDNGYGPESANNVLEFSGYKVITMAGFDKLLAFLKDAPRKAVVAQGDKLVNQVTEAGMYQLDGVIYKVQLAVHGSGNLYAKKLIPGADFGDKARFVYVPGAISKLTADDKLSLEQAKAFGALYGSCCVCGRTLTDEDSIAAGIGPVCANKF
jgi:hypothetical protein